MLKYRSVFPYVLMLVVIAIRPQGLFGEDGAPAVTAASAPTSTDRPTARDARLPVPLAARRSWAS